ncbi:hypothetical protein JOF56_011284 [Kibdelosporangium banguiense]|uniref:DUF6923 domain-containing protein n=1 Tax=Kibdelosporangium banguiense TaxID=1365924 RepID=A0ABS4U2L2_9PSEU|nr:hypothetical protein [Kibdelosporangium banguiense]MBP2330899.1 hypothetical protein [Kibdelosporangium banguiense]
MRLPSLGLTASLVMTTGLIGAVPSAAADGECDAFEVYTPKHGSSSTVVRLSLPDGGAGEIGQFGNELNAIGYAAGQNLLYGVSTRSQVVTIDRSGEAVVRGKVHGIGDATAGAVSGSTLYLRDGPKLMSLDIDPASPTYLQVTRWKWLSWLADVDDFDFGPDALLYGVTSAGMVVSIDPVRGKVRVVAKPKALPHGTYGAVLMSPGRILYAINNRSHGKSRLYRIALNDPQTATEVAAFPAADTTDAAGCLPAPRIEEPPAPPPSPQPPPPPPPPPPATQRPSPPAAPRPPAPTTTSVQPVVRQPAPVPPPIPPTSTNKPKKSPPPSMRPVAAPVKPDTEKKRRWALTTMVLILGAGAAVAATVRNR